MIDHTIISIQERPGNLLHIKRLHGLLDILLAALPIVLLGYIGTKLGTSTMLGGALVTLAYVLAILVAWIVLKYRGTSWCDNGLAWPQSWFRTIMIASGTAVAYLVISVLFQIILIYLVGPQSEIDQSRFNPLVGNMQIFLLMVALAWTTIAFGEEMFFRAFLINRLGVVFMGTRMQWVLAVITSSVMFGLVHYLAEGPAGIINNGLLGLVLAVVYLWSGRNLWITIIAHALLNTLRFTLLFMGTI